MAESTSLSSSQESLNPPLSQETFRFLMDECVSGLKNQLTSIIEDVTITDVQSTAELIPTGVDNMDCAVFNPNSCLMEEPNEFQISEDHCVTFFDQPNLMRPPSELPGYLLNDFQGEYSFEVLLKSEGPPIKKANWLFSSKTNKLYIKKEVLIPISFKTKLNIPENIFIRAKAIFSSPNDVADVVECCLIHSEKEFKAGIFEARHLIRCQSEFARYEINEHTRVKSVVIPYKNPTVGEQFSTYFFKFMCWTSCPGGPNRRPLMLVFTLEKKGEILARRKIDLKVCACPVRDKQNNKEERENPLSSSMDQFNHEAIPITNNKRPNDDNFDRNIELESCGNKKPKIAEEKEYTIKVNDRKCYEFLKGMKKYFVMFTMFKKRCPHPSDFKCLIYSSTSSDDERC